MTPFLLRIKEKEPWLQDRSDVFSVLGIKPSDLPQADDNAGERGEREVKVSAALVADAGAREAGQPRETGFHPSLCSLQRALPSTPRHAIRDLIPRTRRSRRQRQQS